MAENTPRREWDKLRIHFVAVGGIGMSALARIAAARGSSVSGCDCVESATLGELRRQGCVCHLGHSPAHLENTDLVVYSSAVPTDTPELRAAMSRGITVVSRGRMLAWLAQGYDTVAVSGAHGKTTTTWIVANMLIHCGLDPSVAVGGIVPELGGNSRVGAGNLFVTEADESDGSFLHLVPKYPVITNIDADHLDYYSGIDEIKEAFTEFAGTKGAGAVIACADCPNVRSILGKVRGRKITFGIGRGDIAAENVRLEPGRAVYNAKLPAGAVKDLAISLPGLHNVRNSLAALALAAELGLPMDGVRAAFANTPAVGRRLEKRGTERGVTVYDDYAHHPAEIRATLEAARMLARGRLIGVFQPHRYSRTLHLHREFGPVFGRLDLLLIAPIYAASEPPIDGVTSELIAREVEAQGGVKCELVADLDAVPARLARELVSGDTVITIGAGDVWQVGDALLERMRQREPARPADALAATGAA
jgi:UDP-N-acetylmuramate--alanine ligase